MKKILRAILMLTGSLVILGSLLLCVCALFASTLLQSPDEVRKSDAIVVLGGNYYRPAYAAELYKKGYAPKIYCSKPVVLGEEKFIRNLGIRRLYQWELLREILLKKGVPQKNFEFFGEGNVSTIEEAEKLREKLGPSLKEGKRLIVVTSPLHTLRAGIIFRDVMPEAEIIMTSTPYDKPPQKWWKNFRSAQFVVMEAAKIIFYKAGGAFRSSPAAQ